MAAYLGLHRSNVSRLEAGEQNESGPVARLLDQLETETVAVTPDAPEDQSPPAAPELASSLDGPDDESPPTAPELSSGVRKPSSTTTTFG